MSPRTAWAPTASSGSSRTAPSAPMSRGTWTAAGKPPPRSGAVRIGGPRPMRFGRDLYGSPRSNSRLGDRRDFHSDFARVQVPFLREVVPDRPDRVHVPVPIPQDGREPPLEVVDHADHAPFEPIRFRAAVDDVEEQGVATAERDVVSVSHLDAPDVSDAHAVERIVHEVLDRGEHGRDEIGILVGREPAGEMHEGRATDRKSTRLNSSHTVISYAVFCLKKKKKKKKK